MNEEKILRLFHTLHACPEMSGKEDKTRKILLDFLKDNTSLEIRDWGSGFYAAHTEKNGASGNGKENGGIALRADFDALLMPDGSAKHLCGHDGHAAALCETALRLKGRTVGRNVYFLFQPAEETGEGAEKCLDIFREENISEIYGCHNLPEIPFGKVVTRPGTFACGSLGLTLTFTGKPAHAAYPENGISPAHAVGELLELFTRQDQTASYKGMRRIF
jgi:amidohydrolase